MPKTRWKGPKERIADRGTKGKRGSPLWGSVPTPPKNLKRPLGHNRATKLPVMPGRAMRPNREGPWSSTYRCIWDQGLWWPPLSPTKLRGAALRHAPQAATAPLTYFAYLHAYITYRHTSTLTHTDITRHTHTHAHTHAHPHTHIKTYT